MQHVVAVLVIALAGLPALLLPRVLDRLGLQVLNGVGRGCWLAAGLACGVAAFALLRRNATVRFLETLQHEIAHAVAALLLGGRPVSLAAYRGIGSTRVELRGPLVATRSFLVTVAPYWFSPVVLVPVAAALVMPGRGGLWLGLTACALGIGLAVPVSQISLAQPDLRRYAVVPPLAAAAWLWSALAVITLTVVSTGAVRTVPGLYLAGWRMIAGVFLW
ncbi:MAG: hypothetical protein LAO05_18465 [Acidobacteriia bacterium]|nr:hypothetical protein [Terriglobia bacterium]